jgi:hypothetical protein
MAPVQPSVTTCFAVSRPIQPNPHPTPLAPKFTRQANPGFDSTGCPDPAGSPKRNKFTLEWSEWGSKGGRCGSNAPRQRQHASHQPPTRSVTGRDSHTPMLSLSLPRLAAPPSPHKRQPR